MDKHAAFQEHRQGGRDVFPIPGGEVFWTDSDTTLFEEQIFWEQSKWNTSRGVILDISFRTFEFGQFTPWPGMRRLL